MLGATYNAQKNASIIYLSLVKLGCTNSGSKSVILVISPLISLMIDQVVGLRTSASLHHNGSSNSELELPLLRLETVCQRTC